MIPFASIEMYVNTSLLMQLTSSLMKLIFAKSQDFAIPRKAFVAVAAGFAHAPENVVYGRVLCRAPRGESAMCAGGKLRCALSTIKLVAMIALHCEPRHHSA